MPSQLQIAVTNRLPGVALGVIAADRVSPAHQDERMDRRIDSIVRERAGGLDAKLESVRLACRDMLRNGSYKPTGRGKPASEYLLRAAASGEFPRINWPVDVCNYISLRYLLPISLWDLDLSDSDAFVFRLGKSEETYEFNMAGQTIGLQDLVVGCVVGDSRSPDGTPIVNPVKDSMRTKTTASTTRIAAAIYAPADQPGELADACNEFAEMLSWAGTETEVVQTIVDPGTVSSW